jgi:hypothetical protein
MRRLIHLIAVVAVVAAMMVLPGTALAAATNGSCFDEFAKLPGPGPGSVVSPVAQGLGSAPGGNERISQVLNQIRTSLPGC